MSSRTEIRHIVFDVGNTLIYYDPHLAYLDLIPDDAERNWFLNTVCNPEWTTKLDGGMSWIEAENELIAEFPGQANRIRHFRQNWTKMVPHSIPGPVKIYNQFIDEGRDVTILSNFAHEIFDIALAKFPFISRARGMTLSSKVGYKKPDKEIFALHAKNFDLTPEYCLFIDDKIENVASAERLGWNSLLYRNPISLATELEAMRLI